MRKNKNLIVGILFIILGFSEINDPTMEGGGTWGAVSDLIKHTLGNYSMAIVFFSFGIGLLVYYFYKKHKNKKDKSE